ncbi:hypothetical protein [Vagococcus sp. WN89Y]|uniref:hypothetical protein n=1 Tax=Vagococcus sp. WN89Y TaxID=3457258 RepID=UPI003FCC7C91
MSELETFNYKIGQLLVDAGPANAERIIVRAKLSLDGESCEYEYDYIDFDGNESWFVPDGLASHDLRLLLTEMRNIYIEKNMTNGKPVWTQCTIVVDIKNGKINFDFKYDN